MTAGTITDVLTEDKIETTVLFKTDDVRRIATREK
jgi:hypothetical protein